MAEIPSPYLSGCKIRHNDVRSFCTCAGGCKSDYPPPARWVVNVQPTSKHPWSRFVGRHILFQELVAPVACTWKSLVGSHDDPFEFIRLAKELEAPSGNLLWRLSFNNIPACLTTTSFQVDGLGRCCVDLHWGILNTWFSTLCVVGPGPNPDIDVWPVAFDFEVADL